MTFEYCRYNTDYYTASEHSFNQELGNLFLRARQDARNETPPSQKQRSTTNDMTVTTKTDCKILWYKSGLHLCDQYCYNSLTVRFLMYRNTFWVCCGPLIISGKQAASWDVIRSCGSLLWKAAPSTPTIKKEVVYKHCNGTATGMFLALHFLVNAHRAATRWHSG